MKFEHFEGTSPADQFDRLGSKEDIFLSSDEREQSLQGQIRAAEDKVANLQREFNNLTDEELEKPANSILRDEVIRKLGEAQTELENLKKKQNSSKSPELNKENLDADLKKSSILN